MEENILEFAEVEPVAKRTRRANARNNKISSASNNQNRKQDREGGSSSSGRKPVAQCYYRRAKANEQSQNQNHPRNGAATGNVNHNNANGKKNSNNKSSNSSSSKTARNRRRKAIYNRRTSECAKAVLVLLMRGLQGHNKRRGNDCSSSISPESDLTRCFHQFVKAEIRRQYVNLRPPSSPDSSSTPTQSACVSKSRDVALVGVDAEDEEIRQPDDTFGNLVFEVIQGKETQFEEEEEEEEGDRDNYDDYDDDEDDERKSEAEAAEGMETTVQSPEGGNAWEEEKKNEFGDLQETQKLAIMPLPESQSVAYCNIYDCNLSNCNDSNSEAAFYEHLLPSASQELKEAEDEADASKMEPQNVCVCTRGESSVQQDSQEDNVVYCNFGSFSATELSLVPAYPSAEHLPAAPDNSDSDRTPN